jgi:hypothetical protein
VVVQNSPYSFQAIRLLPVGAVGVNYVTDQLLSSLVIVWNRLWILVENKVSDWKGNNST